MFIQQLMSSNSRRVISSNIHSESFLKVIFFNYFSHLFQVLIVEGGGERRKCVRPGVIALTLGTSLNGTVVKDQPQVRFTVTIPIIIQISQSIRRSSYILDTSYSEIVHTRSQGTRWNHELKLASRITQGEKLGIRLFIQVSRLIFTPGNNRKLSRYVLAASFTYGKCLIIRELVKKISVVEKLRFYSPLMHFIQCLRIVHHVSGR